MNIRKDGSKVICEYADLGDWVEFAEGGPKDGYSRTLDRDMIEFSGGTWDDAIKQAKTGNPELVTDMFEGVNILSAMIEQEKVGEIRDVHGEYFDVADYLSGEPECFRRDEYGDRRQVVPVYANFAMNCSVSNDAIRNRGCSIIALCDELSRSGFIVDLHLVTANEYNRKKYYSDIKVGLDPLDLDTAVFIVANPLHYRRLWFAVLERLENRSNCGGYSHPSEYDLPEIFESGVSGFYFVSSNHGKYNQNNYKTLEAAKDHVMHMIDEFKQLAEQVILG